MSKSNPDNLTCSCTDSRKCSACGAIVDFDKSHHCCECSELFCDSCCVIQDDKTIICDKCLAEKGKGWGMKLYKITAVNYGTMWVVSKDTNSIYEILRIEYEKREWSWRDENVKNIEIIASDEKFSNHSILGLEPQGKG